MEKPEREEHAPEIDGPGEERIPYDRMAPRAPEGEFDLNVFVPSEGPLELDVGFGRGMSVFERVARAPDVRLLGIEIKAKWAYKVDARRCRLGLEKVRIVAGDAKEILTRARPDGAVRRVYLHFPDPWWKKRHGKRRIFSDTFLSEVARLLEPAGEIYIQTDVPERAESFRELLASHPDFEIVDPAMNANPFGSISNRERRAAEDGLPVHRILARRR